MQVYNEIMSKPTFSEKASTCKSLLCEKYLTITLFVAGILAMVLGYTHLSGITQVITIVAGVIALMIAYNNYKKSGNPLDPKATLPTADPVTTPPTVPPAAPGGMPAVRISLDSQKNA